MPEYNIDLDGRKLIDTKIIEQKANRIVSEHTYDDGTIFKFVIDGEEIKVDCNKPLNILPDGTIKIIG